MTNKIFPCIWLDGNAKEAAEFYCSVFTNSHITDETLIADKIILKEQLQKAM